MVDDIKRVLFTQYVLPNGRCHNVSFEVDDVACSKARQIHEAGYKFECEILTTGDFSATIVDPRQEEDVAIKIARAPLTELSRREAIQMLIMNFAIPTADPKFDWVIIFYDGNGNNARIVEQASPQQVQEYIAQGGNADFDGENTFNAIFPFFEQPTAFFLGGQLDGGDDWMTTDNRGFQHLIVDYSEYPEGKLIMKPTDSPSDYEQLSTPTESEIKVAHEQMDSDDKGAEYYANPDDRDGFED